MTAKQLSDINLELFRVFYQVARTGSMTQAAKVLFITQPAISHAVSLMEERLGVKLFERSGRRLVLTAEGRLVHESASRASSVPEIPAKTRGDASSHSNAKPEAINRSENSSAPTPQARMAYSKASPRLRWAPGR